MMVLSLIFKGGLNKHSEVIRSMDIEILYFEGG